MPSTLKMGHTIQHISVLGYTRSTIAGSIIVSSPMQDHPNTYYVAPEFVNTESGNEFNNAFLGRQMLLWSRLIPLRDCPAIDDGEEHCITYQRGSPEWDWHSTPHRHRSAILGKDLERTYGDSRSSWQHIDAEYARGLLDSTFKSIMKACETKQEESFFSRRLMELQNMAQSKVALLRVAADAVSLAFGLTLVIVGQPPN